MEKINENYNFNNNDNLKINNAINIFLQRNIYSSSIFKPILRRSTNNGSWFNYISQNNSYKYIIFIHNSNNDILEHEYECLGYYF